MSTDNYFVHNVHILLNELIYSIILKPFKIVNSSLYEIKLTIFFLALRFIKISKGGGRNRKIVKSLTVTSIDDR